MNRESQNETLYFQQNNVLGMVHFVLEPCYNKITNRIFEYITYSQDIAYPKRYRNKLISHVRHLYIYSDSIKQDTRPEYLIKYPQLMAPKMEKAERILNQLLQSIE